MRNLILIFALAMPLSAQTAQQQLDAVRSQIDSLRTLADSLGSVVNVQTYTTVMASEYPDLAAAGVTLSVHPADSLYVRLSVPYGAASDSMKLVWREALVAVKEANVPMVKISGATYAVHRTRLRRVADALDAVID